MNGIETKYTDEGIGESTWMKDDEGIGESIDQRSGNDGLSASRGVSAILQRYQHGH